MENCAGEGHCRSSTTDTKLAVDLPDVGVASPLATDAPSSTAAEENHRAAEAGAIARPGSATLAAIVVGMVAAGIYRRGAFYPSDAFGVAVVSGVLSVIALVRFRDRLSLAATATVGGLALWWFVRSESVHRPAAFLPLGASMLGFLAAWLVVKALDDHDRGRVALALVAVAAVTAAVGIVGVLWRIDPLAQHVGAYWQLATWLTLPGAAAALLAVALVLALALDLRQPFQRIALCLLVGRIHRDAEPLGLARPGGRCGCRPARPAGARPGGRWPWVCWPASSSWRRRPVTSGPGRRPCWPRRSWAQPPCARSGAVRSPREPRSWPSSWWRLGWRCSCSGRRGSPGPAEPPSQGQTLSWSASAHSWRIVHHRRRRSGDRPRVGPAGGSLSRPDARHLSDRPGRRRGDRCGAPRRRRRRPPPGGAGGATR